MYNKLVIHLSKIRQNILDIKAQTDKKIISVVKANAYGHNAVRVAQAVEDLVDMFAVANVNEAKKLIGSGIKKDVLVLSKTYDYVTDVDNIIYMVDDENNLPKNARVHIAINSGMNRYGVSSRKQFVNLCKKLEQNNNHIEGVFSHFYSHSKANCRQQIAKFNNIIKDANLPFHFSSSNSLNLDLAQSYVRLGICQYRNSKEIHTKIVGLHKIKQGEHIGYGNIRVKTDCIIGVLPIGYADGIDLRCGNRWCVEIRGQKYRLIGKICMDCCFVLVDKKVRVGDKVVFMKNNLTEMAKMIGSTDYEQMCRLYGDRYDIIYD